MTKANAPLPPGQYEKSDFPRFGAPPFHKRFPTQLEKIKIEIIGDVQHSLTLEHEFKQVPRVQQTSDFHCVATWSHRAVNWSGFRFADIYEQLIVPLAKPLKDATFVIVRGQDGYRSSLPLSDLLAADVLLADRMEDQPLSIAHGAPIRLVAPAHYGYKNVKHIKRIELRCGAGDYRPTGYRFMAHPRARVAYEERGQWLPGWFLRYLYRPMVNPVIRRFDSALQEHQTSEK